MNKNEIVAIMVDAASALSSIPPGRVDSLRGAVAFQADVLTFRGRLTRLVWALQEDDREAAKRILAEINANPQT